MRDIRSAPNLVIDALFLYGFVDELLEAGWELLSRWQLVGIVLYYVILGGIRIGTCHNRQAVKVTIIGE